MGSFEGLIKVFAGAGAAEFPASLESAPALRPHIRAPIMRAFKRARLRQETAA